MATSVVIGSSTGPGAGAAIATSGTLQPATYGVTVTVQLSGTTAAADLNNVQLQVGATVIGPLITVIPTATGNWTNPQMEVVVPAGGAAITANAIGAGTGTAVYKVQLVINE